MTLDRLSPWPILRGHWKGLTLGDRTVSVPDRVTRWASATPLLLVVPAGYYDWKLAAPEALLAGVALLAGALIGAFGYLATVRLRLQDRDPRLGGVSRAKDLLDESVAHLLTATLGCLAVAVVLVIGTNAGGGPDDPLTGGWAAVAIALSANTAVIFLILLTRLYATYVDAAQPRDELNGLVSGKH